MFEPKTYLQLCMAMQMGAMVRVNGSEGTIDSIQREDGSGRCFNVMMEVKGEKVKEFVRMG